MPNEEIWKPISGFEGLYEISNLGRLRSWKNNKWGLAKEAKIIHGQKGRHYITSILCGYKDRRTVYIHRLVAETFLEKPEGKDFVNHINGNKLDNRAENLEWCTHAENMEHANRTGLTDCIRKKIVCVETARHFKSITEASKETGIGRTSIGHCLAGYAKTANGFHWRYAE